MKIRLPKILFKLKIITTLARSVIKTLSPKKITKKEIEKPTVIEAIIKTLYL